MSNFDLMILISNFNLPMLTDCFPGGPKEIFSQNCSITNIDECQRMENDLNIRDACRTSPIFMASCVNKCGKFSCECRDTETTLVDPYVKTKCYSRKQIRDLIFDLYIDRKSVNIFLKQMNITIESCNRGEEKMNKTFPISFNSFHQLLTNIKDQKWFPIYTDNSRWSEIEFVCQINLTISYAVNNFENLNDFKHVLIEDPIRKRCSVYNQNEFSYQKTLKIKIVFSLALVFDLASAFQSCTNMLDTMDEPFDQKLGKVNFLFRVDDIDLALVQTNN
ncbi:hypothetical protein BpHYR1_001091 [Brachionus plicatilis]|uniref:Uncharacterized protein n=1 Tax=Brachionus plicatilis TaxID=10195 RepID=A0A3M7RHQ6_BRAPC|nr:hypothetical protein BpHYR1_001091 [Brachionus plicatilis]